ncbi:MAG: UDP-N-acetylglucosamine 2-epimerase [Patescibacteria group bacterium]|nr:UDP-N-acetylglucosamine 2-epimerase [Patescibacteria group bacterium]
MLNKKIFFFIGTTAELIKLAPIIKEFNRRDIKFTIIASGQNDIRFEEFATYIQDAEILYAVTPKSKESSMFLFLLWAIKAFFSLFIGMRTTFNGLNKSNSLFIVHGDTVSSLIGSIISKIYGLKLIHVESGLRSFNFLEPFPEELCRYIISMFADVHFCPNEWAVRNLQFTKGSKVNTYENTLIESFFDAIKDSSNHELIHELKRKKKKYFVLVVHRQEHVIFSKKKTYEILKKILFLSTERFHCIFLVHDLSGNFIRKLSLGIPQNVANKITRISRLPYKDFIHLLQNAEFMITDGGSNQEEMYYMGKPCLLLRNYTERIEGLNENVVLSKNKIEVIENFIRNYKLFSRHPKEIKQKPSKIIVDYLIKTNE